MGGNTSRRVIGRLGTFAIRAIALAHRTSGGITMSIHLIYRVVSFQIIAPYTLRVQFDDQTEQLIDFQPVLAGELFGPLLDLSLFNQVRIDPEVHTLVWPNGADYDPATLHDWPMHVEAIVRQARQWELSTV
jgi:hypothetical protein